MAKCYYCGGAGCSQCRKMTTSSYGAEAVAKAPSPNEVKPPVAVKTADSISAQQVARANEFTRKINEAAKTTPKEKLYGWVSQQALRIQRGVIYKRPDGSEVLVTCVGRDPNNHGTGWKDIQCIGEVTDYVRQG